MQDLSNPNRVLVLRVGPPRCGSLHNDAVEIMLLFHEHVYGRQRFTNKRGSIISIFTNKQGLRTDVEKKLVSRHARYQRSYAYVALTHTTNRVGSVRTLASFR